MRVVMPVTMRLVSVIAEYSGMHGMMQFPISPETFADAAWEYCKWAESDTHELDTVCQLLVALVQAAPGLKTWCGFPLEPTSPRLPREVSWAETERFADLPFQWYPPVYWRYKMPEESPWTDNIHEDFAHIYAELRYGLQATEQGIIQAARYWRDSHFFHWGHHGSGAVWAIDWYREELKNGNQTLHLNGGPAPQPGDSGATERMIPILMSSLVLRDVSTASCSGPGCLRR